MNIISDTEPTLSLHSVLLIDDDEIFSHILEHLNRLHALTEELIKVNDPLLAKDAIEQFKHKAEPKLILLDLNMPIIDGWQLLDYMQSVKDKTPVVVLSSSISQQDIERSAQYPNVIRFISKPLTEKDIKRIKSQLL